MKNKKVTLRKCIVCNEHKDKSQLIRIVKDKDKNINIDLSGKMDGRGAYICRNKECINKSIEGKTLNRHLRTNVDQEIYEELMTM